MCLSLYAYFLYELEHAGYYPPGGEEISDNQLFGMFYFNTPDHNKKVIINSMSKEDGTVTVVFATSALGIGVDTTSKRGDRLVGVKPQLSYGH